MKQPLFVAFLLWLLQVLNAQAEQKIALVAGVERYQKSGLTNLSYAEDDALAVQEELAKHHFAVEAVIGQQATLTNLKAAFERLFAKARQLSKQDIVVVYLSGHGLQKQVTRAPADGKLTVTEEPFFCPVDALKSDVSTLLSLNEVLDQLEQHSGSGTNLILLDACRESADRGARGISDRGVDGSTIRGLSDKLALFFAAKSGQRSFENRQLQHGIFTHYLLEGLRGKAADGDNEITLQGLASYVAKHVERRSPELLELSPEEAQRPNFIGNLSGTVVLGTVTEPPSSPKATPAAQAPPQIPRGLVAGQSAQASLAVDSTHLIYRDQFTDDTLGDECLDNHQTVTVLDVGPVRCKISFKFQGSQHEGWVEKGYLKPN